MRSTDHTGAVSEKRVKRVPWNNDEAIKMSTRVRQEAEISDAPKKEAKAEAKSDEKKEEKKETKSE